MSDIKLLRIDGGKAVELAGSALAIEKTLQTLLEQNLEAMTKPPIERSYDKS